MAAIQKAVLDRRAQRLDPQPGRERGAEPLAKQASLGPRPAARHLQQCRQHLHERADDGCHEHPERNQRRAASQCHLRPETAYLDLLQNQVQQSTLGWTAAGAYYLEIAKANATTLSLLNATPVTTAPTYDGLGPALSYDLAPLEAARKEFMTTLKHVVQTTDGTSTPSGSLQTLADAKDDSEPEPASSTRIFGQPQHQSTGMLHKITNSCCRRTQIWTDPFGGLMQLGQT